MNSNFKLFKCFAWIIFFFTLIFGSSGRALALDAPEQMFSVALDTLRPLGPFKNWGNAKRDYGAIGDGVADDTVPLQNALNDLRLRGQIVVLYLPPGVYRITKTLKLTGWEKSDKKNGWGGVQIIGEHPTKTKILWGGTSGEAMLIQDGGYNTRYSRITWDGNGIAGYGVAQWWNTKKSTNHDGAAEHTDEVFQDMGIGIFAGRLGREYGEMGSEGQIRRVTFIRNSIAGVNTGSWNALDWWIWDSHFIDCARGYTNKFSIDDQGPAVGAGAAYLYRTTFERSKVADVDIKNTMWFSMHNNISIGSKLFFLGDSVGRNGAEIILKDNKIYDSVAMPVIINKNLGPLIVIDNEFYDDSISSIGGAVSSLMANADAILIGNKIFSRKPAESNLDNNVLTKIFGGRIISFENKLYPRAISAVGVGYSFVTPEFKGGTIFEVPPDAVADTIQEVVWKAAGCKCTYPIVHIPRGMFNIDKSILIPSAPSLEIAGDGLASVLFWTGAEGGAIFELESPSQASIRDIEFVGLNAKAINIVNSDQPGGRIFILGSTPGRITVDSLRSTQLTMQANSEISKVSLNNSSNVVSVGGGGSGPTLDLKNNSSALFADTWYEGGATQLYNLSSGDFTFLGGLLAPGTHLKDRGTNEDPTILFSNYSGKALFVGLKLQLAKLKLKKGVEFLSPKKGSRTLFLGVSSNKVDYFDRLPDGGVKIFSSKSVDGEGLSIQLSDYGDFERDSIGDMLVQARALKWDHKEYNPPVGATNINLYRIMTIDTQGIYMSGKSAADFYSAPVSGFGLSH